jgi:hypothetical protein
MIKLTFVITIILASLTQTSCSDNLLFGNVFDIFGKEENEVQDINTEATLTSQEIYASGDLNQLCIDDEECSPDYDLLPDTFRNLSNQDPLDKDQCNYDYDYNITSDFNINQADEGIKGVDLQLSKQDLFFLGWASMRYKINPHFLLSIMIQESSGNCRLVSSATGQGCFQITYRYGRLQLEDSYNNRVDHWNWANRNRNFPRDMFLDEEDHFGDMPETEQYREFLDPNAAQIGGVETSSVVNFHYGVIASSLYFHWQQYKLYYAYDQYEDEAIDVFTQISGKAKWQAAAYNGGISLVSNSLRFGENYTNNLREETQNYSPKVEEFCQDFQNGSEVFEYNYTVEDVKDLVNLIADTYPEDLDVDWEQLKLDIEAVFFVDQPSISFVKDMKALIYYISTYSSLLAPEWPSERSL